MASKSSSDTVTPNDRLAMPPPNRTATTALKLSLTRKRKAVELDLNEYPGPESDDAVIAPAKIPLKKARVLKPKPASDDVVSESPMNEVNGMGMFDSAPPNLRRKRNQKKAASAVQQLQASSEMVAANHVANGDSPNETVIPPKISLKKPEPQNLKAIQQDAVNGEIPNGQDAALHFETSGTVSKKRKADTPVMEGDYQRDSVTSPDAPPEKKTKRMSPRTKKASARKLEADANATKKKTMSPPPLPPATINKAVANKVKQVRDFIENEDEQHSKLDRDLENRHLISVPETSLQSVVIRMRVHYEMPETLSQALSDIENAVVQRFKQAIGSVQDIDWVTIDATRRTNFEDRILQKIARHGLDEVNLLEIELEMFKKDHLTRLGLYDETKEIAWDAERFLRSFSKIWERVECQERETDLVDGDDSESVDVPATEGEKGEVGEEATWSEEENTDGTKGVVASESVDRPASPPKKAKDKVSPKEELQDFTKEDASQSIDGPASLTKNDEEKIGSEEEQQDGESEQESSRTHAPAPQMGKDEAGINGVCVTPMQQE